MLDVCGVVIRFIVIVLCSWNIVYVEAMTAYQTFRTSRVNKSFLAVFHRFQ